MKDENGNTIDPKTLYLTQDWIDLNPNLKKFNEDQRCDYYQKMIDGKK